MAKCKVLVKSAVKGLITLASENAGNEVKQRAQFVYLPDRLASVEPEKEVRRNDDDLAPVILLEDVKQECPHLVERSERSAERRVHGLVVKLRISSHPSDDRLVPEGRKLGGWTTC